MTAFSVHDRIAGWVADELAQADPMDADEWGHHVTMAAMQTPQGRRDRVDDPGHAPLPVPRPGRPRLRLQAARRTSRPSLPSAWP